MEELQTIELFIDEEKAEDGVQAISLVEYPAIEENFVALSSHKVEFKTVNEEKRIIVGLALVPNKKIYRKSKNYEYNIIFSEETVRKASEIYLKNLKNNNTTLEHQELTTGVCVIESWVVEDPAMDKSNLYGLNATKGSWVVTMKVDNDDVWRDVKEKKYLGLSIEGMFSDKQEELSKEDILLELQAIEQEEAEYLLSQIKDVIQNTSNVEMESFSDYPESVSNNAKRGIELNEKVNNKCATQTGKLRAKQLSQRKPISIETIKRMFSYLSRAEVYYDESDTEACGTISYLLWGGKSAKSWAESKINKLELKEGVAHYTKDGKLYEGPTHKDESGRLMTGKVHTEDSEYLYHENELDNIDLNVNPCTAGYEMIGFKNKNGRKVPNCVPIK